MGIELIADYLKQTTGLDSSSVGIPVVEQAANKRMAACNINNDIEYYRFLINSKSELDLLIDQVMVPETWFFRGQETFNYLRDYLISRASRANQKQIRILSIPCASGEEPYSIAMVLNECGYTSKEYVVDAIDIAHESLRLARHAVFTDHSFRGLSDHLKNKYFEKTDVGFRLCQQIKKLITFSHGNIFSLEVDDNDRYDIVFCRNLLIYFDKNTQRKALSKIESLMVDRGVLFIGHGEAGCIVGSRFEKIDKPNVFAFSKMPHGIKPNYKRAYADNKRKPVVTDVGSANPKKESYSKARNSKASLQDVDPVDEAKKLADEGRLDEAIERCKEAIKADGASAGVLYLLGVIHDAKEDRSEAVKYYKRAVHLMPNHCQSLMHLASHAERDGDQLMAEEYRIKAMQNLQQPT